MMLMSLPSHKIQLFYDIIHGFQMLVKLKKKNVFSQNNLVSDDSMVYEPEGKKPKSLNMYKIIKYSIV